MTPTLRGPRRTVAALAAVLALTALAAWVWTTATTATNADGPLQPGDRFGVQIPLTAEQTATWGVALPDNLTSSDLTIISIEPEGVHGLRVLGMSVHDPAIDGSITSALGYPVEGVLTRPPEGARLAADRTDGWTLELLVGVRLEPGAAQGEIASIRIEYESDGQTYEVVHPASLALDLVGGG